MLKRKRIKKVEKIEVETKPAHKFPPDECCGGCGEWLGKTTGYIVVGRWHKTQRFHAKQECLEKIKEFILQELINDLDKSYKGYLQLKTGDENV